MDKKFKDPSLLNTKLGQNFVGGQFQLMTRYGEIWRGQMSSWKLIDSGNGPLIEISFNWYLRVCIMLDNDRTRRVVAIQTPLKWRVYEFSLRMKNFYHPKSTYYPYGDPRRIKGLTRDNEQFRFFMASDFTNPSLDPDGNIVSNYRVNEEDFKKGIPPPLGPPNAQ